MGAVVPGFVRPHYGKITSFGPSGSIYTYPCQETCLNQEGAITGYSIDAYNVMHGFSRSPLGTFATFDAPDAGTVATQPFTEGTRPSTNNLQGAVTGWHIDADGLNHGFVWSP